MGRRSFITQKDLDRIARKPHKTQAIFWFTATVVFIVPMIWAVCYFCDVFDVWVWIVVIFLPSASFIIRGIYHTIMAVSNAAKQKDYKENLLKSDMATIDQMNGVTFENYLATLFEKMGYRAETTKKSKDFGVDLILEREHKIIVQAKRYNGKVSISAVQEICAARDYYNISEAWVVTNNFFTKPAISLALANGVRLINRVELAKIIASCTESKNSEESEK